MARTVKLKRKNPGTRAAALPGGHRTGAPGKHVIGGKAKYRLIDEKVRYFVAPSIEDIVNSPVSGFTLPHLRSMTSLTLTLLYRL